MNKFSEKKQRYFSHITTFTGLLLFILTALSGRAGMIIPFFFIGIIIFEYFYRFNTLLLPIPYIMMLISPLTLLNYSHISDFRFRFAIFFFLIYLLSIGVSTIKKSDPFKNFRPGNAVILIIPLILLTLVSVQLFNRNIYLSGDEPHYLMITQSIVDDGDFNLKNNIELKTYMDFIPVSIRPHVTIVNGNHLSYHMPGLSFLLIPFYLIFKLTGGSISPQLFFRISAAIINSFFFFTLFYLLKKLFPDKEIFKFWIVSLLMYPSLFHSVHIFPELPASTLIIGSLLLAGFGGKKPYTAGLLLALSFWFHVKYYPLIILFTLFIIYKYIKKNNYPGIFKFLLLPVISGIILLIYCKTLYGALLPTNIYPPENYFSTPLLLKFKVFFSYFLDQRDGLLFYTPLLFIFLFSFNIKFEKKKLLLAMGFIYLLFHSVTTVRGAYSPAGRPLVFIFWILIVFSAAYYFSKRDGERKVFKLLTGTSIGISLVLFCYPRLMYQPVFSTTDIRWSGLLRLLGNEIIDLPKAFPSFLTHPANFHLPNLLWILLIVVLTSIFYFKKKIRLSSPFSGNELIFSAFLILFIIFCFYPHLHFSKKNLYVKDGIRFFNNSGNFAELKNIERFRIRANNIYDIFFDKRTFPKQIVLELNAEENMNISLFNGKKMIRSSQSISDFRFNLIAGKLHSFNLGKRELIHIGIKIKSRDMHQYPILSILKVK